MKYLLITTSSRSVINFRSSFIKHLKEKNNEIVVISQDDEMKNEIENMDVKFYCVKGNNRSLNPFKMFNSIKQYKSIILSEKPDYVLTYQLKPNTFGVLAANAEKTDNKIRINTNTFFIYQPVAVIVTLIEPT